MSNLVYELNDDRWYDPEFGAMILHTRFGDEDAKPVDVLMDVFGIIEDAGLDVKRVVLPEVWAKHLPLEDGFLWGAWVSHDEDVAPIVAYSNRRDSRVLRTVTVSWAD